LKARLKEGNKFMSQQDTPPQPYSAGNVPVHRPGLVTFAAVMLLLLFGLYATYAILEFVQGTWILLNTANVPGGRLWIWGIVDAIFALVALYAAYDLLKGGKIGRIIGLVYAIFSAVRWLFFLPVAPIAAVVFIAIDILIIYGLVAHEEYFRATRGTIAGL
jgi:hypothetical protein